MGKLKHTCPLCEGIMKDGKTTFTAEFGEGIVVVKNVDAKVCSMCEHNWIDDSVADKLEEIVNEARKKQVTVEVCDMDLEKSDS